MRLIYDVNEISTQRPPEGAAQWSVIIPSAGRGSRLNSPTPKILYPILGKPILEWLASLLKPLCRDFIFVLSPEGAPHVQPLLASTLGNRAQTVLQETPTGMADAVALCAGKVQTPYTLVLWGDQIAVRAQTLAACMTLQESSSSIQATIPTIVRENPYIHFIRNADDRITDVFQARESDQQVAQGESDCGAFFFRTDVLFRILRQTQGSPAHQGAKTKEQNLLSLIPLFQEGSKSLVTVRLHDPEESVGINTPADADQVAGILMKRKLT